MSQSSKPNEDAVFVERPQNISRDYRFKHIIESKLGKNGIDLLLNQSILFVFALIIIVAVVIGMLFTNSRQLENQQAMTSNKSVLLL